MPIKVHGRKDMPLTNEVLLYEVNDDGVPYVGDFVFSNTNSTNYNKRVAFRPLRDGYYYEVITEGGPDESYATSNGTRILRLWKDDVLLDETICGYGPQIVLHQKWDGGDQVFFNFLGSSKISSSGSHCYNAFIGCIDISKNRIFIFERDLLNSDDVPEFFLVYGDEVIVTQSYLDQNCKIYNRKTLELIDTYVDFSCSNLQYGIIGKIVYQDDNLMFAHDEENRQVYFIHFSSKTSSCTSASYCFTTPLSLYTSKGQYLYKNFTNSSFPTSTSSSTSSGVSNLPTYSQITAAYQKKDKVILFTTSSSIANGCGILDITKKTFTPLSSVLLGEGTQPSGRSYSENYFYIYDITDGKYRIIDITDIENPKVVLQATGLTSYLLYTDGSQSLWVEQEPYLYELTGSVKYYLGHSGDQAVSLGNFTQYYVTKNKITLYYRTGKIMNINRVSGNQVTLRNVTTNDNLYLKPFKDFNICVDTVAPYNKKGVLIDFNDGSFSEWIEASSSGVVYNKILPLKDGRFILYGNGIKYFNQCVPILFTPTNQTWGYTLFPIVNVLENMTQLDDDNVVWLDNSVAGVTNPVLKQLKLSTGVISTIVPPDEITLTPRTLSTIVYDNMIMFPEAEKGAYAFNVSDGSRTNFLAGHVIDGLIYNAKGIFDFSGKLIAALPDQVDFLSENAAIALAKYGSAGVSHNKDLQKAGSIRKEKL